MAKVMRVRYEGGVLRPLEPLELNDGEEVLIRVGKLEDRKRLVEEFYGKRGSAPRELLNEFMLEVKYGGNAGFKRDCILSSSRRAIGIQGKAGISGEKT